jgi:hypothetical protein
MELPGLVMAVMTTPKEVSEKKPMVNATTTLQHESRNSRVPN